MKGEGFIVQARSFFSGRTFGNWAWRLFAAFLAFPLAYFIFGNIISPIVLPYYLQGSNELALPGWGQLLPVIALRSLFFLLVCLPILIVWNLSDRRLFLTLGLTLFILVGGIAMIQAYWLPMVLRVTHGLEIFADEMVYAGALVLLLGKRIKQSKSDPFLVPAQ
jgi:nitric oxide reductase large subunit